MYRTYVYKDDTFTQTGYYTDLWASIEALQNFCDKTSDGKGCVSNNIVENGKTKEFCVFSRGVEGQVFDKYISKKHIANEYLSYIYHNEKFALVGIYDSMKKAVICVTNVCQSTMDHISGCVIKRTYINGHRHKDLRVWREGVDERIVDDFFATGAFTRFEIMDIESCG